MTHFVRCDHLSSTHPSTREEPCNSTCHSEGEAETRGSQIRPLPKLCLSTTLYQGHEVMGTEMAENSPGTRETRESVTSTEKDNGKCGRLLGRGGLWEKHSGDRACSHLANIYGPVRPSPPLTDTGSSPSIQAKSSS